MVFFRTPSKFESLEAGVGYGSSAEIEQRDSGLDKMLNSAPKNEIAGPKLLQAFVGRRVFVDSRRSVPKKQDTGGGLGILASQCNKATVLLQNMTVNIHKKRKRLGRRAVPAAGLAQELVEDFQSSNITGDLYMNACSLGFPDGGARSTLELGEHIVVTTL